MYYIVYKTTNLINNKYYIGCHKCNNLNDGYVGSGKILKRAIDKYGIENFSREILHYCNNEEEMKEKEKEIVNEKFITDLNNYNLKIGGTGGFEKGYVMTTTGRVKIEKFVNLCGINKGKIAIIDKYGKIKSVSVDNPKIKNGKYICCFNKNGTINVIDKNTNEKKRVSKEEYNKNDNLISIHHNKILAKDFNNNVIIINDNDERFLNGELVGYTKGKNYNKSEYVIYDNNNNLKYHIINENFVKFCKKCNLPYGALLKSYQNNGTPIYKNVLSNMKRLENIDMIKYTGWYAIKIN
jgi:hypothetical protein